MIDEHLRIAAINPSVHEQTLGKQKQDLATMLDAFCGRDEDTVQLL